MTFDAEKFRSTPIYAFDQQALFSDLLDFLSFSESNIEVQKLTAIDAANDLFESSTMDEPDRGSYHRHQLDSADFRFDVVLSMRLRYAALATLIGTIEWSAKCLALCARFPISSEASPLQLLATISSRCGLGYSEQLRTLRLLIWIRNAITHNAGVLKGYRHEAGIRQHIHNLAPDFRISNWHYIGESVEISKDALPPIITLWRQLIYDLYKAAHEKNVVS